MWVEAVMAVPLGGFLFAILQGWLRAPIEPSRKQHVEGTRVTRDGRVYWCPPAELTDEMANFLCDQMELAGLKTIRPKPADEVPEIRTEAVRK